ncbi:unnamed protein product [Cuscuta epithymum]|uniref:Sec-independent protein translocase protein TATB, chloroplastic n=1 Tax=Cuscuta epithymum TaxID=186058 RepID=A0AAV0GKK7_9ASTE|nr:unnamed protein product [Cuscuta epithymum]CAH9117947.1 unnamed protein product [Cuscuta epithymum]CAH9137014.1 unnamed protein product [Cuscuta epithymum]CAH9147704.1 unnamed protein product [Cuscuta epithymum]
MASAISAPISYLRSSSNHSPSLTSSSRTLTLCTLSNCSISVSRIELCNWEGLKPLGIPASRISIKIGRKRKCKQRVVSASLFGVGAPEALVIGVVALLVFGPKGLAEVARNLGRTIREFQPTIKELQDVSREFKSTLEKEIGLDDIIDSNQSAIRSDKSTRVSGNYVDLQIKTEPPNGSPQSPTVESSDYMMKDSEDQQAEMAPSVENQLESQVKTEDDSSSSTEQSQVNNI